MLNEDMKKSLLWAAALMMVGSLSAQVQRIEKAHKGADESPIFRIEGEELINAKTPTTDSLYWTLPDTVYANKVNGQYALFVYEYDARGNAVRTELFQRVSATWMSSQRIDAHYNRFDAVDTTINYLFINGEYVPQARKISVYDTLGRSVRMTNFTWLANLSMWSSSSRYTYTYTPEGRLKTSLKEMVDMVGNWANSEKVEYTYDAEGRETSFEMTKWAGSEWLPYRAYYYTYKNNRLINELGYILSDVTGRYDSTYVFDYIYNAQDQLTDYKQHFYNDSTASWQNTLHTVYTYNAQNQRITEFTKVFDAALGEMENSTREYYFYNEAGQRDSVAYETWRSIMWSHDISYKYSFNQWGGYSGWIYDNFTDDPRRDKYVFERDEDGNGTRSQAFTLNRKEWIPAERYDLEIYRQDGELILRSNALKVCEITAHYARGAKTPGPLPAEYYTVTLSANDPAFGTVSGEGTFVEGAEVTVRATPQEGYKFKQWQENGEAITGAKAEYTFMLTANRSLTAVFEKKVANEDLKLAEQVRIYPNPAIDVLHIAIDATGFCLGGCEYTDAASGNATVVYSDTPSTCDVELLTLSGVVVEKCRMETGMEKALNVAPYKGIYILRIRQGRAEMVQKIVIL